MLSNVYRSNLHLLNLFKLLIRWLHPYFWLNSETGWLLVHTHVHIYIYIKPTMYTHAHTHIYNNNIYINMCIYLIYIYNILYCYMMLYAVYTLNHIFSVAETPITLGHRPCHGAFRHLGISGASESFGSRQFLGLEFACWRCPKFAG